MNDKYSESIISKLIKENHELKLKLQHKENKINNKLIIEKINIIRFIMCAFENSKNNFSTSSVSLFGSFLENLLYKKPLTNKDDLHFYFSLNPHLLLPTDQICLNPNIAINKFFNIIDNLDFFNKLKVYKKNYSSVWEYQVTKNNQTFRIIFYENNRIIDKSFFNIQNIQLNSISGLSIKYISEHDINKNITNQNISFLEILKSNYMNQAINLTKQIPQNDLYDFLSKEDQLNKKGYKLINSTKNMTLIENCCICYDTGVKGIWLDCQHIFCRECIKKHIKNSNDSVTCPLCRNPISLVYD